MTKGSEDTFGGDRFIHYLDCGYGFLGGDTVLLLSMCGLQYVANSLPRLDDCSGKSLGVSVLRDVVWVQ